MVSIDSTYDAESKPSRAELLVAALPSLIALVLYYSLAIHMKLALGEWPTSIGEKGFSPALLTHAFVEKRYFVALLWFGIFVFPIALLVCALLPRLRRLLLLLAISAAIFLASCLLRLCVPPAFFWWWLD